MHLSCAQLFRGDVRLSAGQMVTSGESLRLSYSSNAPALIPDGLPITDAVRLSIQIAEQACAITISLDATLTRLKQTIQHQTGVAAELQKFLFLGQLLANDQAMLRSAQVVNSATLHAIITPRVHWQHHNSRVGHGLSTLIHHLSRLVVGAWHQFDGLWAGDDIWKKTWSCRREPAFTTSRATNVQTQSAAAPTR